MGQAIALPIPGPVWGATPERRHRDPRGGFLPRAGFNRGGDLMTLARAAASAEQRWVNMSDGAAAAALARLRHALRRDGLCRETVTEALGAAGSAVLRGLGHQVHDTQRYAALLLLDGRLAEMATGEGKTLAAGLAAAVAALAGTPVHVITANDYLVRRDAQQLEAVYRLLSLKVASLGADVQSAARAEAYAADVMYATARELVFDDLRASLSGGASPRRGLCMAIVDEADSILIDEATVPLVLSRPTASRSATAFWWQAACLARHFEAARDFNVRAAERTLELTSAGEQRLQAATTGLQGDWRHARRSRAALQMALTAQHLLRRDEDYLLRDGTIVPLDRLTGRAADGRVWSRGLHTLLELKEGCTPGAQTEVVARTTYQRFFQRYVRLAGMSGSLADASRELFAVYELRVCKVPLHRPCQRRDLGVRLYGDAAVRWAAVVQRILEMRGCGRPVLVGTDSIADAETLSNLLAAADVPHAVLHAHQDAAEADIIARAGQPGAVTVATRMAGRGTDIRLGEGVEARGGLHVINCQWNTTTRVDRQLAGRAARQGDQGSAEALYLLPGWHHLELIPSFLVRWGAAAIQRRHTAAQGRQRQHMLRHERDWARQHSFLPGVP